MATVILLAALFGVLHSSSPPGYYPPVESHPLPEASVRARCTVGERRRFDFSQCAEYEECVYESEQSKQTKWIEKKCADGYSFNDYNGNCELDERCAVIAKEKSCSIPFFRVSCSELLVCAPESGAYVRTNCADGYRNDYGKGCVADEKCTTKPPVEEKCKDGASKSTANCRTYSLCVKGKWRKERCFEANQWKAACSECDPAYEARQCVEGDTKSVNGTTTSFGGYGIDPREVIDCVNYDECKGGKWTAAQCAHGKGYDPSAKRCTEGRLHDNACNPPVVAPRCDEGQRIIPPHSCRHFLQCYLGEWREMACEEGSIIDIEKNRCVPGTCEGSTKKKEKYERGKGETDGAASYRRHHNDYSDSSESSEFEPNPAFFAEPAREFPSPFPNHRRLNGAPEPFSPLPQQQQLQQLQPLPPPIDGHRPGYLGQQQQPQPLPVRPQPYPVPLPQPQPQPVYQSPAEPPRLPGLICEGDFKVADAFDAAYYYDCVRGYLKRRACPANSLFDPMRSKCLKDYSYGPEIICYEKQTMPTAYCGEYRICHNNQWLSGICEMGWAFINGVCDRRKLCKAIAQPPPVSTPPTCAPGSVRPDFSNPNGYLECDYYYNWVKRNCERGGVFDKRISRCVYRPPSYTPPANPPSYPDYKPACYEGEMRKDEQYSTKYEICQSGRFEPRYCPYGSGFDGYHCAENYGGSGNYNGQCQESAGLRGFLPDRTDCGFFYQCAQGKWVRMPCAPGTHFSPQLGVCDHIGNVPGCGWNGPRPTHY